MSHPTIPSELKRDPATGFDLSPGSVSDSDPIASTNLQPDAVLEFQSEHESDVRSYPRRLPLAVERAEGAYLWDTRGQKFLDFLSGAGVMALGHHHPEVDAEIVDQITRKLPYQTLDLTSRVRNVFIRELLEFIGEDFSENPRIQFCGPTGADAVEAALKLAKLFTGRSGIFSFQGGYHGATHGALAVTSNISMKGRHAGLMQGVHFFPYPYSMRCPFGIGGEEGARAGLRFLESALADPESGVVKPAAVILEAIQGEGGVIPAPAFWLRELRRITEEHGVLLIMDEIQSGIGRTGAPFAYEESGIKPDILLMSKAVGGGLPLSVMVFDQVLDIWKSGEHCGTFRGNQLAIAAGAKTLQIIKRDDLCSHAATMGQRLMTGLGEIADANPETVGEVRGRGLMVGMEIVVGGPGTPARPARHAAERVLRIQHEALKRGLIIERGGRHGSVLRFLPPLITEPEHIDRCIEVIGDSLKASAT